jgi:hypothetical protein
LVVHLDEGKLFVQLGENGGSDGARWILDLGATNHMMGVANYGARFFSIASDVRIM